jgi:hypothetical protein
VTGRADGGIIGVVRGGLVGHDGGKVVVLLYILLDSGGWRNGENDAQSSGGGRVAKRHIEEISRRERKYIESRGGRKSR